MVGLKEIRDPQVVEGWLCAGLCLARLQHPTTESLSHVVPWIRASLSDAPTLPPVGVIADVGRLLERVGSFDALAADMLVSDPQLGQAIRSYEEQFLGRLAGDRRFEAAADAIARLSGELRNEGIALLVAQLLQRIQFDYAVAITPVSARRVLGRPEVELREIGLTRLRASSKDEGDGEITLLTHSYQRLAVCTRHASALLTDRDIFTLENLDLLRNLTQRVAIQQMVDPAERLENALPRRIRRHPHRRGVTPTRIEDENTYPAGGFSSISTLGSLENLVCSELIYMDDNVDFDLFDVRYSEGELLYYTRDDSVFLRNRREIIILLHPNLIQARFKDAELPWQRLVLLFGLLLCVVRRLIEWLDDEALSFEVLFVYDEKASGIKTGPRNNNRKNTKVPVTPLATEYDLCKLLFREWINKGIVRVGEIGIKEAIELRGGELILMELWGTQSPELDLPTKRLPVTVDVSQKIPRVTGPYPLPSHQNDSPWRGWTTATKAVLQQLI